MASKTFPLIAMEATTKTGIKFLITYSQESQNLQMILETLPELGIEIEKMESERKTSSFLGRTYFEKTLRFTVYTENTVRNITYLLNTKFDPEAKFYFIPLD